MSDTLDSPNAALNFGGWQAPVDVSAAGQNAYGPRVAVDGQGNAVAVWYRSNGTNLIVQSAATA
jgi:hypothetical protein